MRKTVWLVAFVLNIVGRWFHFASIAILMWLSLASRWAFDCSECYLRTVLWEVGFVVSYWWHTLDSCLIWSNGQVPNGREVQLAPTHDNSCCAKYCVAEGLELFYSYDSADFRIVFVKVRDVYRSWGMVGAVHVINLLDSFSSWFLILWLSSDCIYLSLECPVEWPTWISTPEFFYMSNTLEWCLFANRQQIAGSLFKTLQCVGGS